MWRGWSVIEDCSVSTFASCVLLLPPAWTEKVRERAGIAGKFGRVVAAEFDLPHYSRAARRRFKTPDEALCHYLFAGAKLDREPRKGFSPKQYLRANPDVFFEGYEAFAHYCHFGRHERRLSTGRAADQAPVSLSQILGRPRPARRPAVVDVVMPVHGNRNLALRAIDSVLQAATAEPFELVVLDDASPDSALSHELEALASSGLITLLVNERRLGFVQTANRGLLLHPDRDVVLLNSDTYVFDNWLDRLLATMQGAADIGTATPLSNAATILSYPVHLRDNEMEVTEAREVDGICRSLALGPIDIPTSVGFCMAIRRVCLDQVGLFDASSFGRGYGEENDFCMRATGKGWRHVAAPSVLVWHKGGGSFQAERDMRIEEAQVVLQRLHPTYHMKVRAFVDANPLKAVRSKVDVARVARDPRSKVLDLRARADTNQGEAEELVVRLAPDIGPFYGQTRVFVPQLRRLSNFTRIHDTSPDQALADLLTDLRIGEVRISVGTGSGSMLEQRLVSEARRQGILGFSS